LLSLNKNTVTHNFANQVIDLCWDIFM